MDFLLCEKRIVKVSAKHSKFTFDDFFRFGREKKNQDILKIETYKLETHDYFTLAMMYSASLGDSNLSLAATSAKEILE